jgi:anti-sigma regulatory factor (Ser/Thr protein kinase)
MQELSLHILDIVQNSVRANADKIEVLVEEIPNKDIYSIEITDNGSGVDADTLVQIADPFFTTRTTRKVGMGISLYKQSAEQAGGSLIIESEQGKGTKLKAVFSFSHLDRPAMGDIAGTMTLLIGSYPQIRFIYVHRTPLSDFEFDTKEVKAELEGVPINNPKIMKVLKEIFADNLSLIEATLI